MITTLLLGIAAFFICGLVTLFFGWRDVNDRCRIYGMRTISFTDHVLIGLGRREWPNDD